MVIIQTTPSGMLGTYLTATWEIDTYYVSPILFREGGWSIHLRMTKQGQTKTSTTFIGEEFSFEQMILELKVKLQILFESEWT